MKQIAAKCWPALGLQRTNVRLRSSSCLYAPQKVLRAHERRRLGSLKQGLEAPEQCKRSASALVCAFALPTLASPRRVLCRRCCVALLLVFRGRAIAEAAREQGQGCPTCSGTERTVASRSVAAASAPIGKSCWSIASFSTATRLSVCWLRHAWHRGSKL